jgi:hypothetical protein
MHHSRKERMIVKAANRLLHSDARESICLEQSMLSVELAEEQRPLHAPSYSGQRAGGVID